MVVNSRILGCIYCRKPHERLKQCISKQNHRHPNSLVFLQEQSEMLVCNADGTFSDDPILKSIQKILPLVGKKNRIITQTEQKESGTHLSRFGFTYSNL